MNWIKATESLPLAGKEVLCIVEQYKNRSYKLGYLCCRNGWQIDDKSLQLEKVIMWSELPAIEPE
jgi:hypothetical protein